VTSVSKPVYTDTGIPVFGTPNTDTGKKKGPFSVTKCHFSVTKCHFSVKKFHFSVKKFAFFVGMTGIFDH
jgi:hypothetical protein